jgi:hypothetical protein
VTNILKYHDAIAGALPLYQFDDSTVHGLEITFILLSISTSQLVSNIIWRIAVTLTGMKKLVK